MKKRSCRKLWLGSLLSGLFIATLAWAETTEIVTYYPAPSNASQDFDRLHARRVTIGDDYKPLIIPNSGVPEGNLFVSKHIGIGFVGAGSPLNVVQPDTSVSPVIIEAWNGSANTPRIRLWAGKQSSPPPVSKVFIEMWKDSAPSKAIAVGMVNPGVDGITDDLIFSTYEGTTWQERMRILNANGNVGFGITNPHGPSPTNNQNSNVDVNDVYLRTRGTWLSEELRGYAPVGSIMAWHKSFPNTPALPQGWVECNGQVLNDPQSPYNGQTIPNLNSAPGYNGGRFLRGGATSGTMQSATKHLYMAASDTQTTIWFSPAGYNGNPDADSMSNPGVMDYITATSDPSFSAPGTLFTSRPVNMSVVWIMRVK